MKKINDRVVNKIIEAVYKIIKIIKERDKEQSIDNELFKWIQYN